MRGNGIIIRWDFDKTISVGKQQIPWEKFSEEEIHLLLSEFLEDEGYKVFKR